MAERNENGIENPDHSMDDNNFEQELLEPNFDVNIPFPRNRMPNAHPEPVGRYYLGEWSRAEREYQLHARNPGYRPPVFPVQVQDERPRAERVNPPAAVRQEAAVQDAGAGRSVSPVPPLPFAAEDFDETFNDQQYERDLALAMDNIDMLNNMNAEIRRRPRRRYDFQPVENERDFTYASQARDINDTYKP